MRKSKVIFVKDLFVFKARSTLVYDGNDFKKVFTYYFFLWSGYYLSDWICFFITFRSLVYFCSLLGYVFAQLKIYSINENKTVNLHIIKYVNYWVEKIRNNKLPEQILPRVFNSLLFNYMWIIHVKHDLSRFY